ncbi:MAG TPA: 2'-5' RNA ligase family protein [Anaerolineae bacterium]|nr:2'-5' RNA ligase family protein [Anaerolineae bacterium]MCB0178381.1 2'-5' RNA ligase family protein [Anaerolineae bacterium]MCB0223643.1 2'-5' RNA ligase family protein [Anaerolineae bacterium]MCB9107313.1 2'-5' RNA ligase family protein [Anaerolineales bacterium]HRV90924.1 2'-5' RNA ligase family protein [Anaerolineae bacterium]
MYTLIAPVPIALATALNPYRQKYDPLASVLPPHISILSPFEFSDPPELLYNHFHNVGETFAPIKVSIAGWDTYRHIDYQIRLPALAGRDILVELRENLLTGPLKYCPGQDKDYSPHIILGKFTEQADLEKARQDLQGFEPQFIFRVTHLELRRWEKPGDPWKLRKKITLEATLAGARRTRQIN